MAPRFWIELRRLTITFLRDMAMAPLERHTETIIGSISGVRPTATARAKKKASIQLCLVSPLITNTSGTMTSMKRIISQVKLLTPLSKLVCTCWPTMATGHAAQIGRPRSRRPRRWRVPLSTLVPRKQMFFSSSASLAPSFRGVELLDRQRLAGQARSPAAKRTMSPGHQLGPAESRASGPHGSRWR
jgi:hypothetical protein